ncbi:MAG: hypothetical protein NTU89_04165 [Candidatus Dependentiae bacterium]|nr:hypothetical protein [Candidatus Dependentiae bacterium]
MKNKLMLITLSCLTVSFVQSAPSSDLRYVEGLKAMTCKDKVTSDSDWRIQPKNKVITYKGRVVSQGVAEQFEKCQSDRAAIVKMNTFIEETHKDLALESLKLKANPQLLLASGITPFDIVRKANQNDAKLAYMKPGSGALLDLRNLRTAFKNRLTPRPTQELLNRRNSSNQESVFDNEGGSFKEFTPTTVVAASAVTGFAKKPTILLQAAKSMKAIPVRGKVGLGMALAGTAGTIVYKKYANYAQDATEVVELSTPEVAGTESTPTDATEVVESSTPEFAGTESTSTDATEEVKLSTSEVAGTESIPTVETPRKTEPLSLFQNLKASTWDKELFGYKNGGKVATTAALTVAVGTVSYAAYKTYVYRHAIKAYISSKNPFSKSN